MISSKRFLRLLAAFLGLALIAAACNSDDDDAAPAGGEEPEDSAPEDGDEPAEDDGTTVDIGGGAVIDLADCPSDWDDMGGITEDTITFATSVPQSGALASFGAIPEGMQIYFDQMEPIDGKSVEIIARDDAYDPARTTTNVDELLQTEDPAGFLFIVGSPNNGAVRPTLNEECVPQLLNGTGLPAWGDPETFPWTIGGLLAYNTEARIWCEDIVNELGEGATVAGVFFDNDFGKAYEEEIVKCDEEGLIDLVENQAHAETGLENELTTALGTNPDAIIIGSTGAFCPAAATGIAASGQSPLFYMSNTCSNTAAFLDPTQGAADGVRMAQNVKNFTDPAFGDDADVQEGIQILADAGRDASEGSISTGILFAKTVEELLKQTFDNEGEITRSNIMKTIWQFDYTNPLLLDGIDQATNGAEDAYLIEGARIDEYTYDAASGAGSFTPIGDVISVEGETGSVTQPG